MKRLEATNTFQEGMVMDFNPLTTPNNVVTNCLNGTLLTFNGNEYVLLNDMGNGRVETACLPEGYVPLGTAELGGIIYIVSYNPFTKKCLIGSFPSPERNITTDELGEPTKSLNTEEFYSLDNHIESPYKKLILLDKELHPGDKFQIYCAGLGKEDKNYISALKEGNTNANLYPKYLKFNIVAVLDNGRINNLNNTLVWNTDNNYYIKDKIETVDGKPDLDEYRDLIYPNYSVFNSKVDGKLAILAQLECIDTFDISWDAIRDEEGQWNFYFFLNWTYDNDVSRDKINLYSIKIDCNKVGTGESDIEELKTEELEIEDYPASELKGTTDILQNQDVVFYTPKYIDTVFENPNYVDNDKIPRRNDGTDNQYLLYKAFTIPSDTEGVVLFTVYPGMPFGYLDYLKHTFSVDLDRLGTGNIDLKEYRYWFNANNITLNWALDAYPERNKLIDSVKFNFYKFDETINTWVLNNGENIDNDRVVETKDGTRWENGANTIKLAEDPTYTHTVSKQSSYSGNFTESINTLENDQLYLVEIEINYNKSEKIIYYYRFLYTSNVFNDYYFNVQDNDFKNIILEEALQNYHPITYTSSNFKTTNIELGTTITDLDNKEITNIPSNLDNPGTKNYKINSEYSCDVSFDLIGRTDNSLFDISVNNISVPDKVKPTLTSNSYQQVLDSSLNNFNTESLDDVQNSSSLIGSFSGNAFSGKFSQTLVTPFLVDYKISGTLPIPYTLSPLDINYAYLIVDGGSKWIDIYVSDTYLASGSVGSVYKNCFSDDHQEFGSLIRYTNVYNEIKSRLKGCDVVALRFRVYHTAKDGSQGNWTMWGQGTWNGGSYTKATNNLFYNTKDILNNGASLLLYAMLDTNDGVRLFTFALKYSSTATWYNLRIISNTDKDDSWPANWTRPFAIPQQFATDNMLKKPFEKYYKLVESNEYKTIYPWNIIYYYNNYTWTSKFEMECIGNITIKINELSIKSDTAYPKNLHYTSLQKFPVLEYITGKENFDQYLNMVLYPISNTSLVRKEDGTLLEIENASPKKIYDEDGDLITYLKLDKGVSTTTLKNLLDTKYKLLCNDERVKVLVPSVLPSDNLMVIGRSEELNITISNIIKLTSTL